MGLQEHLAAAGCIELAAVLWLWLLTDLLMWNVILCRAWLQQWSAALHELTLTTPHTRSPMSLVVAVVKE